MFRRWFGISILLIIASLGLAGCGDGNESDDIGDGGADSSTDTDTDADASADTDTDTDTETSCDDPLEPVDVETILPPNGATVTSDYNPLKLQIRAPMAKPECATDVGVEIGISVGVNELDFESVYYETVAQGELVTADLDLSGYADGDSLTISFSINAEGAMLGTGLDVFVTYGGPGDPVEVTSCLVYAANVGVDLDIRCHGLAPGGMDSLAGGWGLAGGPAGAEVSGGEITDPDHEMAAGDVAWHDYTVTASDGISASAPFDFSVPVDLHLAYLSFDVSFGQEKSVITYRALVPESAADVIALACAGGFDVANKPASAADAPYVLSIDGTCAKDAVAALPAAEGAALFNYLLWAEDVLTDASFGQHLELDDSNWSGANIEYQSAVD